MRSSWRDAATDSAFSFRAQRETTDPVAFITAFSRALRGRGLPATAASSIDAVRALSAVDITDRDDVYFALRSVFTTRRQDFDLFDEVFEAWWGLDTRREHRDRPTGPERPRANPPVIAPWDAPKVGATSTYLTRWAVSLAETSEDETVPRASPSTRCRRHERLPSMRSRASRVAGGREGRRSVNAWRRFASAGRDCSTVARRCSS